MSKAKILEAVKTLDVTRTRQLLDDRPELLNVLDRNGNNLLHAACCVSCDDFKLPESASTRMVSFLLDRGLEIDQPVGKDKCTALFFAVARARNTALIKLLIKRGAKPANAPGGGLFAAGWWDAPEHVKLLLRAGADIDIIVGITPFLASWCWRRFEAAKALATSGANVNFQDKKGRTALHHGIEKEFDPALLTWLVKHGASPDIPDAQGVTARARASRKRDARYRSAFE